ncbi:MAG: hypothetical protein HY054_10645 [Proteobacteria bacterium]|nr:hypothetical protein [Pseudomonadota bacterium]
MSAQAPAHAKAHVAAMSRAVCLHGAAIGQSLDAQAAAGAMAQGAASAIIGANANATPSTKRANIRIARKINACDIGLATQFAQRVSIFQAAP